MVAALVQRVADLEARDQHGPNGEIIVRSQWVVPVSQNPRRAPGDPVEHVPRPQER